MHFMIRYSETPGLEALRAQLRDEHINYRKAFGAKMIMAGPLLSDDGEQIVGSVILVEADGREHATAIAEGDPLVPAGVLKVEDISVYRIAVIRPPAPK
jgi:uncharacterized protein YciI